MPSLRSGLVAVLVAAPLAAAPPAAPPKVGAPLPRAAAPAQPAAADPGRPQTLEWLQLIPEAERKGFQAGPPPPQHDYLSGESGLAAQQPMNYSVNGRLDGRLVRVPGFIVPLELDGQGRVTEFFLVPYYGACIHVPPPAPNQMLFVTMPGGLKLDSMYAAYWVSGRLTVRTRQTKLGTAAYALAASAVEDYTY